MEPNGEIEQSMLDGLEDEAFAMSPANETMQQVSAEENVQRQEQNQIEWESLSKVHPQVPSAQEYDYVKAKEEGMVIEVSSDAGVEEMDLLESISVPLIIPFSNYKPQARHVGGIDIATLNKEYTDALDRTTPLGVVNNTIGSIGRVISGSAFNIVVGIGQLGLDLDLMGMGDDNLTGKKLKENLPEWSKPGGEMEKFASEAIAWMGPYSKLTAAAGTVRFIKAGQFGKAFVSDTAASGIITQLINDPEEGSFGTFLGMMIGNPDYTRFMDSKIASEEEGVWGGRLAMGIDDALISSVMVGAGKGTSLISKMISPSPLAEGAVTILEQGKNANYIQGNELIKQSAKQIKEIGHNINGGVPQKEMTPVINLAMGYVLKGSDKATFMADNALSGFNESIIGDAFEFASKNKFNIDESVAYGLTGPRSLIALHNMDEEKFTKSLELGGLVNPSIQINPHDSDTIMRTAYGNLTKDFGVDKGVFMVMKNTAINPNFNVPGHTMNSYGNTMDVWSGMVPDPSYEMTRARVAHMWPQFDDELANIPAEQMYVYDHPGAKEIRYDFYANEKGIDRGLALRKADKRELSGYEERREFRSWYRAKSEIYGSKKLKESGGEMVSWNLPNLEKYLRHDIDSANINVIDPSPNIEIMEDMTTYTQVNTYVQATSPHFSSMEDLRSRSNEHIAKGFLQGAFELDDVRIDTSRNMAEFSDKEAGEISGGLEEVTGRMFQRALEKGVPVEKEAYDAYQDLIKTLGLGDDEYLYDLGTGYIEEVINRSKGFPDPVIEVKTNRAVDFNEVAFVMVGPKVDPIIIENAKLQGMTVIQLKSKTQGFMKEKDVDTELNEIFKRPDFDKYKFAIPPFIGAGILGSGPEWEEKDKGEI